MDWIMQCWLIITIGVGRYDTADCTDSSRSWKLS